MQDEQRAHPRYAIELDAQLVIGGERTLRGRTQDMSRGGFCLLTPAAGTPVAPGTSCTIKLALVFSETEFSEQLSLPGLVAWCTRLKEGVQIGVKFDGLDAQSRGFLDLFIKFLEDGREPVADDAPDDPRK